MSHTQKIKDGIEPYREEIEIILEFTREEKSQTTFDEHFSKSPTGGFRKSGLPGDGLMLGDFSGYGTRNWWLDLLQHMIAAGYVSQRSENHTQFYQTKP